MEDITIHLSGRNYSLLHNEIFHLLRGADAVNAFAAGVCGPTWGVGSGHAWGIDGGEGTHRAPSRQQVLPLAPSHCHQQAGFHGLALVGDETFRGIGVKSRGSR